MITLERGCMFQVCSRNAPEIGLNKIEFVICWPQETNFKNYLHLNWSIGSNYKCALSDKEVGVFIISILQQFHGIHKVGCWSRSNNRNQIKRPIN